ncbi:plasmalemma vesicle-associated protein [Dromaius novaehollandiae]|uniref:plasmalemma vesicle-associated protein n=1 Tax=Dromaius novaehollandiae TaxID=8790 RepID=UPI00311FADBD
MDKSSYAMAKFGLESKEAVPKRDCGFYMKYVFLFTSLIQFLIILGLVLFMVYGNAHAGTDTHLQLLERQMQDRYNKIITLSGRNANLTRALNATAKERQGLQALAQKLQRDLDKCNSSQAALGTQHELQQMRVIIIYQKTKLDECHMTISLINASCQAEKATLQSQQDQVALARRQAEESCAQASAALGKVTRENEGCQRELLTTKTSCDGARSQLELQKRECVSLRADVAYSLQRIRELLGPFSCGSAQEQLSWLAQRAEGLFLWQQERDTKYVGKTVCSMTVAQCQLNCSHDKQDLDKRLQDAEKRLQSSQEEKKKLAAAKEQLGKELEEKSRAAVQAAYLREQLNICMASKMDAFPDVSGARVPGAFGGRPGAFGNAGTYVSADALRNQGIFGNMGKINVEEIQRSVQKIMEQYAPKNPSG